MRTGTEVRLETPAGQLATLKWPAEDGARVLCLHGWLDNAASFIPMAQYLDDLGLVALDFAGHGQSQHRHASAHYHFIEYLWDVDAALQAMGWDSCHLVGHSLGASVAAIYAAANPGRVKSLVMLDALGPITKEPAQATELLRRSMESTRSEPRRNKAYASIDEMINARTRNSDLSVEAARLICERSARFLDTHYEWTNDPRLHWVSAQIMSEQHALNYLGNIESPVLSLTGTPLAKYVPLEKYKARSATIAHGRHELLAGTHHFHMDKPQQVAETIRSFILEHDQEEA